MIRKMLATVSLAAVLGTLIFPAGTVSVSAFVAPSQIMQQVSLDDSNRSSSLDGGCGAVLDNPHYSAGAGGVIVKNRYICDLGFSMTVTGALTYLYFCGNNQPTGSQEATWTGSYSCAPVRSSNYSNFGVGSNQTVTRYTPPQGQTGATGKGWYVACTRYTRTGVSGTIRIWSAIVRVTW